MSGWATTTPDAPDSALDALVGVDGTFNSSARFEGRPGFRASSAFDGTPTALGRLVAGRAPLVAGVGERAARHAAAPHARPRAGRAAADAGPAAFRKRDLGARRRRSDRRGRAPGADRGTPLPARDPALRVAAGHARDGAPAARGRHRRGARDGRAERRRPPRRHARHRLLGAHRERRRPTLRPLARRQPPRSRTSTPGARSRSRAATGSGSPPARRGSRRGRASSRRTSCGCARAPRATRPSLPAASCRPGPRPAAGARASSSHSTVRPPRPRRGLQPRPPSDLRRPRPRCPRGRRRLRHRLARPEGLQGRRDQLRPEPDRLRRLRALAPRRAGPLALLLLRRPATAAPEPRAAARSGAHGR